MSVSDKIISIYAPSYDPYSGYGRMACELIWHLSQRGWRVNALGQDHVEWADVQHVELRKLLNRPIKASMGGILLGYPTVYPAFGPLATQGPRVALTMFESTVLPEVWPPHLNRCDVVVVPAQFLVKVFRDNGVAKPVRVVPLGISENYNYVPRPKYPDVFTFLCLGDGGERKGWKEAVLAFAMAFGKSDKHKLIIKARDFNFDPMMANVEVIRESYAEHEMQELFASVNAFVFPTHGEGFGLPPREAAATGLPVIATNWGGTADDLTAWGYPLKYTMEDAWVGHPVLEGNGKWAKPDVEHLAKQMQWVASKKQYFMWHQMRRDKQSENVARRVRKLYSWAKYADGVEAAWMEAMKRHGGVAARRQKRRQRREAESASD